MTKGGPPPRGVSLTILLWDAVFWPATLSAFANASTPAALPSTKAPRDHRCRGAEPPRGAMAFKTA